MKVRLQTDTDYRKKTREKGASSAVPAEKASSFLEVLEEILPSHLEKNQSLHDLWSVLPDVEKKLIEKPVKENLNEYKRLVREIAEKTLKNNTRVKKIYSKNRRNEKVEHSVVEFIDRRVQAMAVMLHSSENSAFSILKSMEEIRGILLDLKE